MGVTALCAMLLLAPAVASPPSQKEDCAAVMRSELPSGAAFLFNIRTGVVVAAHGEDLLFGRGESRPVGSILKLFTAYALLAAGEPGDEVFFCAPSSPEVRATDACWHRPGHGNMTLRAAIANSCNAYFRQWTAGMDLGPAEAMFRRLGLLEGALTGSGEERASALTGLSSRIRVRPAELAAATAALFNGGVIYSIEKTESGARCVPIGSLPVNTAAMKEIAAGMRESAVSGTGAAAQAAAGLEPLLVKTGTSQHFESGRIDPNHTDGWCIILFPAQEPRYLLLISAPGGTGSGRAAEAGGAIVATFYRGGR